MRSLNVEIHVRRAAIAAGMAAGSAFVAGLLGSVGGLPLGALVRWRVLDAALMTAGALAFSRRSRAFVALCLAYFVASRALLWVEFERAGEAILSVVLFGYFLVQGARAAFAAHRGVQVRARPPAV